MKFWKSLFGNNARKYEDKADELRLDFEYRDAAFYYRQAIDALEEEGEDADRLNRKLREVRRQALDQLLEEAEELTANDAPALAREKLETAMNFADEDAGREEVERRLEGLGVDIEERHRAEEVETVAGTEGDLFELALSGLDPRDRERASALGEPFRRGYEACQREEWAEALTRFTELLEKNPDDPLLLELCGMASENTDDAARAAAYFERARDADPARAASVQGLAAAYRKLEREADARRVISDAAAAHPVGREMGPEWADIHVEHALLLSENGHHDEAVTKLVSLADQPGADRGRLLYNLGGVLERAGRASEGRAALEGAIESSPRQPLFKERLADLLVKEGADLDIALRLLVEANQVETTASAGMLGGGGSKVTISPNRARYLYKIARIYFLKGEDLEADRTITTALAVSRDQEVTGALEELRRELKEVRQPK